ncbi:hypothetical protein R1flu_015805 [Riccia fluitans]|uniref:Uncharacterized protein n=1 Tax=Riccia fluitans TaxID=41844 RepID=A0ABD1YN61_9MARC
MGGEGRSLAPARSQPVRRPERRVELFVDVVDEQGLIRAFVGALRPPADRPMVDQLMRSWRSLLYLKAEQPKRALVNHVGKALGTRNGGLLSSAAHGGMKPAFELSSQDEQCREASSTFTGKSNASRNPSAMCYSYQGLGAPPLTGWIGRGVGIFVRGYVIVGRFGGSEMATNGPLLLQFPRSAHGSAYQFDRGRRRAATECPSRSNRLRGLLLKLQHQGSLTPELARARTTQRGVQMGSSSPGTANTP